MGREASPPNLLSEERGGGATYLFQTWNLPSQHRFPDRTRDCHFAIKECILVPPLGELVESTLCTHKKNATGAFFFKKLFELIE